MPDYRDNRQGRRPPNAVRRPVYDDRPPRTRAGSGAYMGDHSRRRERSAEDYYGETRGQRARRSEHASQGEYLADGSQDRYADRSLSTGGARGEDWFDENRPGERRQNTARRTRESVPEDDLSFDDIERFDPDDDWFAERSEAYRYEGKSKRADADDEDWLTDDFDDEDTYFESTVRAPERDNSTPRRRTSGWFEEEQDREPRMYDLSVNPSFRSNEKKKKNIITAAVCGALVLVLAVGALVIGFANRTVVTLPMETVLKSMTVEQGEVMIEAYVNKRLSETVCNVTVGGASASLELADCEMTFAGYDDDHQTVYIADTDDTTGELIRVEYAVDGVFRYNRTVLRSFLDSLLDDEAVPVVDPYFEIDYETGVMTVYSGTDGWGIDVKSFISQLGSGLMATGGDTVSLSCSSGAVSAQPLSAAEIYKQAATKPADAFTTTDAAGQTVYHSEINGVEFSQSELEQLIASGGTQWEMKVNVTYPETNLKDIKKYTFPDLLASYYTYYNGNAAERSHNLALAAEHINSIILEPGQQFSFNETVGERNKANGFKKAAVYAGEGTSEDYGGGICQTSSTLYYTCILANLQIDERRNHMYTVGYMQTATGRQTVYGNDATVNWGYTDFKFTNSKEYPIRIDIWAKGGVLTCEIRGTADGYTADFEYETLKSTPYMIKYLPDDGTEDQSGHTGYNVNVYRVIYKDGERIDRVLESQNNYKPMNTVYYTNDLPAGFEYGVEYDQDYTPPVVSTTDQNASTE